MRTLAAAALLALAGGAAEPAAVAKAKDAGVAWLRSRQAGDGSWGGVAGKTYDDKTGAYTYPAGLTGLALFALLRAGVPPDDPQVERGFKYLASYYRVPRATYEIAILMLALDAKAPRVKGRARHKARDRAWMRTLLGKLLAFQSKGGWRYGGEMINPHGITEDMSHTQLAVLALRAARDAGLKVPGPALAAAVEWILAQQDPSGPARGWAYARKSPVKHETSSTGTMTGGAVAALLVAGDLLKRADRRAHARLAPALTKAVSDGLAWLDLHWRVDRTPATDGLGRYQLMHLYGLERIGGLMGTPRIGTHRWFDEGAAWIVENQHRDGRWECEDTHEPRGLVNTCFALLFLSRGTRPLASK